MNGSPPAAGTPGRGPAWIIFAGALAWIGVLLVLVLSAANPVVVNRAQVLDADVIVLGEWQPGPTPRLTVERTWKSTLAEPSVEVRPLDGASPRGRVIVPLTRVSSRLFTVTHGRLPNPPEHPAAGRMPREIATAEVRPQVYPATDAVIRQLEAFLSPPNNP